MRPLYKTFTIDEFDKFVSTIRKLDNDGVILFRGQCVDRPLIPKIGRIKFVDNKIIIDNERKIINHFKRLSVPYLQNYPRNDWEWLSLAQHHGLPTRLLDWSTNPLAALWFVVHCESVEDEHGNKMNGVVWMFCPEEKDLVSVEEIKNQKHTPFSLPRTLLFQPAIVAQRINAQQGWFSIHKYDRKKNMFTPFEKNRSYKNRLVKFIISADKFPDLRYDLDRFGINRATLFPDLDGLTSHIEWLKSCMKDERASYD